MNLGVTLKAAEKAFGPTLPGPGAENATLAAIHFAAGKGKKFAGILGYRDDAVFHVHFPTPIDWSLLAAKKGTPDYVNDLTQSGPQGEQGRERLVAAFLDKFEQLKEQRRLKQEAAEARIAKVRLKAESAAEKDSLKKKAAEEKANLKKAAAAEKERLKHETDLLREGLIKLLGEQEATVTIGSESFSLFLWITKEKSGKIKIAGSI